MEMDNICITCLATDRKLNTLQVYGVFSTLDNLMVEKGYKELRKSDKVCWECFAQLNNVRKFQNKAFDSLRRLQGYCLKTEVHLESLNNSKTTFPITNINHLKINGRSEVCENGIHRHKTKGSLLNTYKEMTQIETQFIERVPHNYEEMIKCEEYEDGSEDVLDISQENVPDDEVDSKVSLAADVRASQLKENADELKESANEVKENADELKESANELKESSNEVKENADELKESANELKESSNEVKEISIEDNLDVWNDLLKKTPQIRVKEFAHIKEGKTDSSMPLKKIEKPSEPPWRTKILSDEELNSCRNTELSKESYLRKPFKCTTCIISYWCDLDLEIHNKQVHDESKGCICKVCNSRYTNEEEKEVCTKSHYSVYQCSKCDFYSWSIKTINTHNKNKHRYGDFRCRKCRKDFETFVEHARHYKVEHRKSFKCDKCNTEYFSYKAYTTHSLSHKIDTDVNCSKCKKTFRSIIHLRIHMRDTHSEKEQVYCEVCDKFITAVAFKAHLEKTSKHIKADMMRFECDHCQRKFSESKSLKNHIKVVHLKIYEFKCDFCPKLYSTKCSLKRHLAEVHDPNYVKQLRYICHVCGNRFLTRHMLKTHSARHTGEKPYQCSKCPFKTGYKASLHKHNQLVHEKLKRKTKTVKDS